MTLVRIGTSSATQGPLGMCLEGERRRRGYDDAFLVRDGARTGRQLLGDDSKCIHDGRGVEQHVTQARCWYKEVDTHPGSPQLVGFHVLRFDGYKVHVHCLGGLAAYDKHRIMCAKEEADSSQLNQSFDKKVAKDDKSMLRDMLGLLRTTTSITRGVVDQWGLVHVGLAVVRMEGSAWEISFKWVNMHPDHRLSFEEWIEQIAPSLQSSCNFKVEAPV